MKKLLVLLCTLFVLGVGLFITLSSLLQVEAYKPYLSRVVYEKTGKTLEMKGKVGLTFFPTLALTVDDIALREGENGPVFVSANRIFLNVDVWSLLKRNLVVHSLKVVSPVIYTAEAKFNPPAPATVAKLPAPAGTTEAPPASKKSSAEEAAQPKAWSFRLDELAITDGHIIMPTGNGKELIEFKGVDFTTGFSGAKDPFSLKGKLQLPWQPKAVDAMLSGILTIKNDHYEFESLKIALDAFTASGTASLLLTDGKVLDTTVSLMGNTLVLSDYLPPSSASSSLKESTPAATQRTVGWNTQPFDFSFLKGPSTDINLKLEGFIYQDLTLGEADINFHSREGRAELNIKGLELYEGNLKGVATIDITPRLPAFTTTFSLDNLELSKLPKDSKIPQYMEGKLTTNATWQSSGRSQQEVIQNLSGEGKLAVKHGNITGIDLLSMVQNVANAFAKPTDEQKNLRFATFSGSYTLKDGVLSNRDLALDSELVKVFGTGTVDLPARQIDYRLVPQPGNAAGLVGVKTGDLTVPILVEGDLLSPRFTPDTSGVVRDVIEHKYGGEIEKLQDKLKKKLPKELQDIPLPLENFFPKK